MNGKEKKIFFGAVVVLCACTAVLGGLSLFDKSTDPSDGDYGEWVVTREPSCEEKGIETRALLSSPAVTQVREIPARGHSWGEWEEFTAPTCFTEGANRRFCSVCQNYDYTPVSAFGHDWGE